MRFGMGFIAPLGRSLSFRYMFIGDVIMCRNLVVGRMTRNATNAAKWMPHSHSCASEIPERDQPSKSDESGYPTNDHRSKWGRPSCAIRSASVKNPVTAITRNVSRITASSGLVLMRMRYGRST